MVLNRASKSQQKWNWRGRGNGSAVFIFCRNFGFGYDNEYPWRLPPLHAGKGSHRKAKSRCGDMIAMARSKRLVAGRDGIPGGAENAATEYTAVPVSDVHIHGGGHDVMEADENGAEHNQRRLPAFGTTRF